MHQTPSVSDQRFTTWIYKVMYSKWAGGGYSCKQWVFAEKTLLLYSLSSKCYFHIIIQQCGRDSKNDIWLVRPINHQLRSVWIFNNSKQLTKDIISSCSDLQASKVASSLSHPYPDNAYQAHYAIPIQASSASFVEIAWHYLHQSAIGSNDSPMLIREDVK
jgi:hypothetical protein